MMYDNRNIKHQIYNADSNTPDDSVTTASPSAPLFLCPDNNKNSIQSPYIGKSVFLSLPKGLNAFYHGTNVSRIPLASSSLIVGKRDLLAGFYPDIDLSRYCQQDHGISLRHLRIYRDINGFYFVEDLAGKSTTFLNSFNTPINRERVKLHPGDKIFVSHSVVFEFCVV